MTLVLLGQVMELRAREGTGKAIRALLDLAAKTARVIRPDGSGSDHVFKNTIICPGAMIHARSIPGSRKIVTTAAGHHGGLHGPIVLIDNRRHRRTADAMENLTPEIRYPGLYPMPGSIGAGCCDVEPPRSD